MVVTKSNHAWLSLALQYLINLIIFTVEVKMLTCMFCLSYNHVQLGGRGGGLFIPRIPHDYYAAYSFIKFKFLEEK